MDFVLAEEQRILQKSAHDFLEKECPNELVRNLNLTNNGFSSELWKKMAELGWMGMIFPEKYGGYDGSFLDLTVLLEEIGYYICPGPFLSTVILGGIPLLLAGNEACKENFLSKIANGEIIVTMALNEPKSSFDPESIETKAVLEDDGYKITGTKLFVPDASVADYFLCVARTSEQTNSQDGLTIFIVDAKSPGVQCTSLKTLGYDKQCELQFDNVFVSKTHLVGEVDKAWPVIKSTLEYAAVGRSAEMIGGAKAVMNMALQYAKERSQFEQPIGSFQAIQHHFTNMWIDIDGSKYLVNKAAWMLSEGRSASKECSMAKAHVGKAYRRVTVLGHQIFGGIGFTEEHNMHLYHRRSAAGDSSFGNYDFHRENIAVELGL